MAYRRTFTCGSKCSFTGWRSGPRRRDQDRQGDVAPATVAWLGEDEYRSGRSSNMITRFGSLFAGHVDLDNEGLDGTPANDRWLSDEDEGRAVNPGLLDWKESFGARTYAHDFHAVLAANSGKLQPVLAQRRVFGASPALSIAANRRGSRARSTCRSPERPPRRQSSAAAPLDGPPGFPTHWAVSAGRPPRGTCCPMFASNDKPARCARPRACARAASRSRRSSTSEHPKAAAW